MSATASHEQALALAGIEPAARLLAYNDDVLAQGEALARAHEDRAAHDGAAAPDFGTLVGPHLRHIIEHYEALLLRPFAGEVDYDGRPRDRALERSPALARQRIAALRAALRADKGENLDDALVVFSQGGVEGQWPLATASTVARELVFLASHTVHHFALLREHCARHGIRVHPYFGIAAATVAHARKRH
jgi:hypothetical protein